MEYLNIISSEIPEERIDEFTKDFAKLCKKFSRYGLDSLPQIIYGEKFKKSVDEVWSYPSKKYSITIPEIIANKHRLIGIIEHTEKGTPNKIISHTEFSENFHYSDSSCEFCQKERNRKKTFVLKNEEEITFKVGTNCLKKITKHPNADKLFEFYFEVRKLAEKFTKPLALKYVNLDIFLSVVKEEFKKNYSPEFHLKIAKKFRSNFKPKKDDQVKEIILWMAKESNSLNAIAKCGYVNLDNCKSAAHAYFEYKRWLASEKETKFLKENSPKEFFGKIGYRIGRDYPEAKVRLFSKIPLKGGKKIVSRFLTEEGHLLVWYHETSLESELGLYSLSANISKHRTNRGYHETYIVRVDLRPIEEG